MEHALERTAAPTRPLTISRRYSGNPLRLIFANSVAGLTRGNASDRIIYTGLTAPPRHVWAFAGLSPRLANTL